jgi:hypothetical protein
MELLDGMDLDALVRRTGHYRPDECLSLTRVSASRWRRHIHADWSTATSSPLTSTSANGTPADCEGARFRAGEIGLYRSEDSVGTMTDSPWDSAYMNRSKLWEKVDHRGYLRLGCVAYFAITGQRCSTPTAFQMINRHLKYRRLRRNATSCRFRIAGAGALPFAKNSRRATPGAADLRRCSR